MRKISLLLAVVVVLTGSAMSQGLAEEISDRATKVELVKTKYLPILDKQYSDLRAIKIKAKVAPSISKEANTVFNEFEENYQTILNGLKNPSQDIDAIIALCDEEVAEFDNYIFLLKQQLSKLKTITCLKGKSTKKIVGLNPVCPAGYKKK